MVKYTGPWDQVIFNFLKTGDVFLSHFIDMATRKCPCRNMSKPSMGQSLQTPQTWLDWKRPEMARAGGHQTWPAGVDFPAMFDYWKGNSFWLKPISDIRSSVLKLWNILDETQTRDDYEPFPSSKLQQDNLPYIRKRLILKRQLRQLGENSEEENSRLCVFFQDLKHPETVTSMFFCLGNHGCWHEISSHQRYQAGFQGLGHGLNKNESFWGTLDLNTDST